VSLDDQTIDGVGEILLQLAQNGLLTAVAVPGRSKKIQRNIVKQGKTRDKLPAIPLEGRQRDDCHLEIGPQQFHIVLV